MALFQFTLLVGEAARADRAIPSFLCAKYPALTKNEIKRWFKENRIHLIQADRRKLVQAHHEIRSGSHQIGIEGLTEESLLESAAKPSGAGSFLEIVFEDENILVLNKLSGVPSLPQSPQETETAVGSALAHCPALAGIGVHPLEPGLLHRLDTATSGLLAFAKSQTEYDRLRSLWKTGEVKKTYRARVAKAPPHLPLEIKTQLAHDPHTKKKMIALTQKGLKFRGKPLDAYTRIVRAHSEHDLEIEITTGVMHQIRCHLSSAGLPIVGDTLYRGAESTRLWLHSWKLELPTAKKNKLVIVSKLPELWSN